MGSLTFYATYTIIFRHPGNYRFFIFPVPITPPYNSTLN